MGQGKHGARGGREPNSEPTEPRRTRRSEGPAASSEHVSGRNAGRFWQTQQDKARGGTRR